MQQQWMPVLRHFAKHVIVCTAWEPSSSMAHPALVILKRCTLMAQATLVLTGHKGVIPY